MKQHERKMADSLLKKFVGFSLYVLLISVLETRLMRSRGKLLLTVAALINLFLGTSQD